MHPTVLNLTVEVRTDRRGRAKGRKALDAMRLRFQPNLEANGIRVPVATQFAMGTTARVDALKRASNLEVDVPRVFTFALSRVVVQTIPPKNMASERMVHPLHSRIGLASMLSKLL